MMDTDVSLIKQTRMMSLQKEVADTRYEHNDVSMREGLRSQQDNQRIVNDRASAVQKLVHQVSLYIAIYCYSDTVRYGT